MPYKVVLRRDASANEDGQGVLWEPGCPILIEVYQVSRDKDSGAAYLQARIRNISATRIDSFVAQFVLTTSDKGEFSAECHPLDADIDPGGSYDISPIRLEEPNVLDAKACVVSAICAGKTWTSTERSRSLPQPKPLAAGLDSGLIEEKNLQIASIVGNGRTHTAQLHMTSDHGGWWQCACEQLNVDRDSCCSCGAALADLKALDSAEHLRELAKNRQLAQQRQHASRKRALRVSAITGGVAVVLLVTVFLVGNFVVPKLRYNDALESAKQGDYSAAYAALLELGDYSDAPAQAQVIGQSAIDAALANGDFDEALSWCQTLGDDKRSLDIKYQYVQAHLDSEDTTTYAYLTELKDAEYKDADTLYKKLYAWNFEFAICSGKAWNESGETWMETSTFGGDYGEYDYPILLARATGGEPGQTKRLSLDFETIEKDTQIHSTGQWEGIGSKPFLSDSIEVKSDGSIATASVGSSLYWKAWRVTVTNPATGDILTVKEIHLEE